MDYEKILDEFIREERKKSQAGSGDDLFYELQIEDYVNKQRPFWVTFMKFIENKIPNRPKGRGIFDVTD